jgi:hypothetical protein
MRPGQLHHAAVAFVEVPPAAAESDRDGQLRRRGEDEDDLMVDAQRSIEMLEQRHVVEIALGDDVGEPNRPAVTGPQVAPEDRVFARVTLPDRPGPSR